MDYYESEDAYMNGEEPTGYVPDELVNQDSYQDLYEPSYNQPDRSGEYEEFINKYPGIDPTDISPETWAVVANEGKPLSEAFEKNDFLAGFGSGKERIEVTPKTGDDFLDGFNSK